MKDTFFITTAIHYANAPLHMGQAYEMLLADVIARYKRERGANTFFLAGSDEHGDKIIRTAQKNNMGPQAFVDGTVERWKDLYARLNISYDAFIRTSDRNNHWPGAQELWKRIAAHGDLYKGVYRGLYCVGCEAFITEKELVDGKCPNHGTVPERIEEENYFFRLSKYRDQVRDALVNGEIEIIPATRANEMLTLLDKGVEDISFSRPEREIPWGIPVPGEQKQMMYVWCDALANYVSAVGFGRDSERFLRNWPADVHVIGKDILRFHAIMWPAMLLSADLPFPKRILVHGFITSGGRKMSKTIGNVIDPYALTEEFGADPVRYYFIRVVNPTEDGDFTREKFLSVYNGSLAHGLGNLISRTVKMAQEYFGDSLQNSAVSAPLRQRLETMGGKNDLDGFGIPYIVKNSILPSYVGHMDQFQIHRAADAVWQFLATLDKYIADYEPYKLIKSDREKTQAVVWNALYGLYYAGIMIVPLMPATAETILAILGAELDAEGEPVRFSTKPVSSPLFAKR